MAPSPVVPFPSVITWAMMSASIGSRGSAPASEIATRAPEAVLSGGTALVSVDQALVRIQFDGDELLRT